MSSDSGAQNSHPPYFSHPFYQPSPPREADLYTSAGQVPQGSNPMAFSHSQMPALNMQMSQLDFQALLGSQDASAQQGVSAQMSAPSQAALLEQQMRLNQLQQLQQLQNQIFQQQLELLSGQNTLFPPAVPGDRQRDQQQFGLPTPAQSTELRAQPSPDFVSPMILQSNAALSNMHSMPPNHGLPDFPAGPNASHSAPANIAFQINPSLPLHTAGDLDFSDFSPLTSPWLEPYSKSQHASGPSTRQQPHPSAGNKRRMTSSSGDESNAPSGKPVRKRPSSAVKTVSRAPAVPKKAGTRGTRSANSTPQFPATLTRSGGSGGGANAADVPNDTPSPIELPPMPPPAQIPSSIQTQSLSPVSHHPGSASVAAVPVGNAPAPVPNMTPVTPASIMNLGRLGIHSSVPQNPIPSGSKKVDGSVKRKSIESSGEYSKTPRSAEKGSAVSLVSPSLKPIRPAGNTPLLQPAAPSPTTFAEPGMQVRKSSHKAAEQKRRDSLKTSFDDLRLLLPPIPLPSDDGYPDEPILPGAMPPRGPPKGHAEGPNRGVSKLQLLRCGNDYIKLLKGRVDRRDEEMERLRREVARLRLLVSPEAAQVGEEVDLEKDLDAVEFAAGGLLARGQGNFSGVASVEGDEGDEEGC
ncbi:uncharacterized protein FIBRA_01217 [Fibroporia radiculosa]|uniref:BHLH domain-containing protein n=1 Tax=Fibroporia radiculosa TaxID=599839 RepID=J4HSY6_9APHY|nr:uncharacterized protein FIBRA_01217 [Fibroporia radiculosa]CCL99202.1 predicted protein [Fibroporia radiculosa]